MSLEVSSDSRFRVQLLLLCIAAFSCIPLISAEVSPPNMVIIIVDDMGFSDIGCYGGEIDTQHLDDLEKNGLR
ncbi:MAG: arylsulfatase, partial [Verrucomicrobiota bacterium]